MTTHRGSEQALHLRRMVSFDGEDIVMPVLAAAGLASAVETLAAHHGPEVVIGAIVLVLAVASKATWGGRAQRDPQRIFTAAQRQAIFERCGYRCEAKRLLQPRCSAVPTHADHIYPWSKGGATSLANGQGLCAHHNLSKSNRVPSRLYRHALERRRRRYFPDGMPVEVVWHIGVR